MFTYLLMLSYQHDTLAICELKSSGHFGHHIVIPLYFPGAFPLLKGCIFLRTTPPMNNCFFLCTRIPLKISVFDIYSIHGILVEHNITIWQVNTSSYIYTIIIDIYINNYIYTIRTFWCQLRVPLSLINVFLEEQEYHQVFLRTDFGQLRWRRVYVDMCRDVCPIDTWPACGDTHTRHNTYTLI
jgi:hypothetical protein